MELMKLFSERPENFPRVLSAFVRRETLMLCKMAAETCDSINEETQISRGRYLGEFLEDLAQAIQSREEFLEYFRDIPLGKNSDGEITTGEIVRLVLADYRNQLMKVREDIRRDSWSGFPEDEYTEIKEKASAAAQSALVDLKNLDDSLTLAWSETQPEPKSDFDFIDFDLGAATGEEEMSDDTNGN